MSCVRSNFCCLVTALVLDLLMDFQMTSPCLFFSNSLRLCLFQYRALISNSKESSRQLAHSIIAVVIIDHGFTVGVMW